MRFGLSRLRSVAVAAALLLCPAGLAAQNRGAVALAPLVNGLGVNVRVLMIAAHPDDEDTQLLTWLGKGRQVESAYLALTRGDGGQNIIGNELGEPLGAIRTEELLAARRMDGARQYFTRAFDFGFSKNAEETLTQWSRDSVFRDVITVVRAFRPHVIVSVFSGTPADGHGHHQVAGILAREAYDLSADTVRFPRASTAGHGPWLVAKFYRGASFRNQERATIRINVGEFDPVMGRSYSEVAADSRSQHKSQAMGSLQLKGVRFDQLMREASRVGPQDATTERSLFDGIDTTWGRFHPAMRTPAQHAALSALPAAFAAASSSLNLLDPAASIPSLVRLQQALNAVCGEASPENPCATMSADGRSMVVRHDDLLASMEVASSRVESALALASGVAVEVTASRSVFATGETFRSAYAAFNRGKVPLRLTRRVLLSPGAPPAMLAGDARTIAADSAARDSVPATIARPGQPWWLERPRQGPMFGVAGRPGDEAGQQPSPVVVSFFEVAGGTFGVFTPISWRYADAVRGEVNQPVVGAPAITLTMAREVEYAQAAMPIQRTISIEVRSHASEPREVDVRLELPSGLVPDSAVRHVSLAGSKEAGSASANARTVSFTVRGRLAAGSHVIRASATSGGQSFATGYTPVSYDHIRTQRLYRPSTLAINAVDLQLPRGVAIAYIPGVGDNIAPVLQQLGLDVTVLDPAALPRTDLSRFSSVVVGTRAYEAQPALVTNNARLLEYAKNGGTLVVQYGQYEMLAPGIMPYPITLGRPADRVTVEGAPVTILSPAAPVLNGPNKITNADFAGWTQDRTLYTPRTYDPAYQALLETHDPNEAENRGALLVAPLGRGTYVYTTLAFFRQLPNGVPGAARLFVNLLSARPERVAQ